MAASRWMGRGDKLGADGAAVEAMRTVLSSVPMDGVVVIGEGEKDNATVVFNGGRSATARRPSPTSPWTPSTARRSRRRVGAARWPS